MISRRLEIIALILTLTSTQIALADIADFYCIRGVSARVEDADGVEIREDQFGYDLGSYEESVSVSALFDASASQTSQVSVNGDVLHLSGSLEASLTREEAGPWARASALSVVDLDFVPVVDSVLAITYQGVADLQAPHLLINDMTTGQSVLDFWEVGDVFETIELTTGHQYAVVLFCGLSAESEAAPREHLSSCTIDLDVIPTTVAVKTTTLSNLKAMFK